MTKSKTKVIPKVKEIIIEDVTEEVTKDSVEVKKTEVIIEDVKEEIKVVKVKKPKPMTNAELIDCNIKTAIVMVKPINSMMVGAVLNKFEEIHTGAYDKVEVIKAIRASI